MTSPDTPINQINEEKEQMVLQQRLIIQQIRQTLFQIGMLVKEICKFVKENIRHLVFFLWRYMIKHYVEIDF